MPSLCSIEPVPTSLGSPSDPSSFTQTFGTMNSDSPLVPCGCSVDAGQHQVDDVLRQVVVAAEIQHFVPLIV